MAHRCPPDDLLLFPTYWEREWVVYRLEPKNHYSYTMVLVAYSGRLAPPDDRPLYWSVLDSLCRIGRCQYLNAHFGLYVHA